jgi:two-component system cell cycle sensor histidine kinase/response regulator CckA
MGRSARQPALRPAGGWPGFLGRRIGGPGEAFRLLFGAAPEGMALLNASGAILAANPALGRLAGPAVPIRPGLAVAQLVMPAERPALAALLAQTLAGLAAAPLAATPADPTAPEDASWEISVEALPAGAGAPLLLRVGDRTAARRAEARLAAAGRLETIGRLAGGIAHDFNNLLAVILGGAGAIRAGGIDPAQAADAAAVEDAARRGAALVAQLLAFARQQRLQPRILELNAAVAGIAPLLRRLLGEAITLELRLEEPGRRVRVDPAQLDQVILNLAANAREAMPAGGMLRIATGHAVVLRPEGEGPGALPPGRYAVLEVADTGGGIPPEVLPRLFEPFFTTRPDKGGTGLGLATVHGIIAQSGGHIGVISRPGEGSCFRIHLPRQDAPAEPPPAPPAPAPAEQGERPVLLVEDETSLARLAERLLQRAGHAVVVADCAESALDLIDIGVVPAALVSDVAMPGMDGVALARALRQRWPGLPVVLLSGYAESLLGQDFEGDGFRFLAKPYVPQELLHMLAQAMPAKVVAE